MPFFRGRRRALRFAHKWARTGRRPFLRHRTFRRRFAHPHRSRFRPNYPDTAARKFTYHYNTYIVSGGAATFQYEAVRGNSIFDPQYAVGGGTPAGYNEAARLWTYYDVRATKITVHLLNGSAGIMADAFLFAVPVNDVGSVTTTWASILSSYQALKPEKRAKLKLLQPAAAAYAGKCSAWMSMYCRTQKVLRTQHDGAFEIAFGSNPSAVDAWLFVIAVGDSLAAAMNMNVFLDITVTYYTRLRQRSMANLS